MDHREGGRGEEFDDEIAVADGVERVRRHTVEAEVDCRRLAVERVPGAGERARSEWRDIRASPAVRESPAIALEHLDVGEEVMREEHGLCRLDVGRTGQNSVVLALGEVDERTLEAEDGDIDLVGRPAQPETQICRDLVVAGASRVELAGHRPHAFGERGLEVEVHVLELGVPLERSRLDVGAERLEPLDQDRRFVSRDQSRPAEAADVRDRAREIVERQGGIDRDRTGELGHPLVARPAEASAPESHAPPLSALGPAPGRLSALLSPASVAARTCPTGPALSEWYGCAGRAWVTRGRLRR